ncbi:TfoX/Sxy family protein [Aquabacterium sp. A7-Y]|uniref:TfoX/Sxy family protein n=1 Tax=Aquabacterium sp. A7-Y TaxID=1349605 RepID=UPI00223D484E|nr:TfoX/Sxy family protein [Aquabacterium sp. A7-Y]MCW7540227.1 TfoX/Sxy family protein [Aquabacterium sp. A7-Y]
MSSLAELPHLGPASQQALSRAGITSVEQLRRLGSVAAYAQARRSGARVSLNLLWALEAALTGLHWQEVARLHRTSLLLALDEHERQPHREPGRRRR